MSSCTPADAPETDCGIYHNPSDPRVCLCVKDRSRCGRPTLAANLGNMGGKLICFLQIALIAGCVCVAIYLRVGVEWTRDWTRDPALHKMCGLGGKQDCGTGLWCGAPPDGEGGKPYMCLEPPCVAAQALGGKCG
jgi:hypothetical protein